MTSVFYGILACTICIFGLAGMIIPFSNAVSRKDVLSNKELCILIISIIVMVLLSSVIFFTRRMW